MSIRPVDLQVLIPRSAEVNKTESPESRRPEVMNQLFANTLQKRVEQDQQQVLQTYRPEQDAVDKDGSNKNNQEKNKKKNRKTAQELSKTRKATSTSMIDISI